MADILKRSRRITVVSAVLAAVAGGMGLSTAAAAPELPTLSLQCKSGFVWREVTSNDLVCVTPGTRAQVKDDNAHAAERRVSEDDPTCKPGFVWREAQPSDLVCVTPGTRAQAKDDNAHAAERRVGG
ncbi:hypothetical protein [Streptomyces sp. NPDC003401]